MMNVNSRGARYSRDEWIVLYHYFCTEPEAAQTDSHPDLIAFARRIGRPPGSVDANLRTIKMFLTSTAGFEHGAKLMREVVNQYRNNMPHLARHAAEARVRNHW